MRAFVAVDAPETQNLANLQRTVLDAAGWDTRSVKPVKPENFHFTLMFLGEVDQEDRIVAKLSEIEFKAFEITLQGIGCFPHVNSARVVWVGVDPEGGTRLGELAAIVVDKMKELGFKPDKPFSPHLTIARAKDRPLNGRTALADFDKIRIGSGSIDRLHLKKSDLRPLGPVYSNVYTLVAVI